MKLSIGRSFEQRRSTARGNAESNSPIRVLAFLEAHTITGPAKAIIEFARETGHSSTAEPVIEIIVATFLRNVSGNDFTRAIQAEGIKLEVISERRVFDGAVIGQMRLLVERCKPDIVWTHAVKSHFLVRAAGLHKRVPWLVSNHGYTSTNFKVRMYNQLDRWSHRGAKCVLTVCESFAGDLSRRGVERSRIRVRHNPIRMQEHVSSQAVTLLRERLGLEENTRTLLCIGRLSREKGHADLIRAYARARATDGVPVTRLVIVGDGPERGRLQSLSRKLRLDGHIVFAGHQSDVRPFYAIADLLILPSHSEGSPLVLLEAMEADIPVVATSVGGVPEIVSDERSALLVPARHPAAMAAAIVRLLNDEALQARLKAAAREVLKLHTPEIYSGEIRALFAEVVSG